MHRSREGGGRCLSKVGTGTCPTRDDADFRSIEKMREYTDIGRIIQRRFRYQGEYDYYYMKHEMKHKITFRYLQIFFHCTSNGSIDRNGQIQANPLFRRRKEYLRSSLAAPFCSL